MQSYAESYCSKSIRQSSMLPTDMTQMSMMEKSQMMTQGLNQTQYNNELASYSKEMKETYESVMKQVYVPVAFVIQTKAEFHDHFKLILKKIYESFTYERVYPNSI